MVSIPRGQKEGWCFDDAVPLNWIMVVPLVGAASGLEGSCVSYIVARYCFVRGRLKRRHARGFWAFLLNYPPYFFPFDFGGCT